MYKIYSDMKRYSTTAMRVALRGVLMLLLLMCGTGLIKADNDVQRGDSAYAAGRYAEAIEAYREVAQKQGTSAALLYNLGNAYYKNGEVGRAVGALYSAYRLDPQNREIRNNLDFIEGRVAESNLAELRGKKGNVSPDEFTFFQSLWNVITVENSSNFWAIYAVMAFILFIIALAMYIFAWNVNARKVGFFGAVVLFIFSAVFVVFALVSAGDYMSENQGVVIARKIQLLEAPKADAHALSATLHEGTRMEILERETSADGGVEWYKVKLNSDLSGWVSAKEFIPANQN